jgi:hypothetical protein
LRVLLTEFAAPTPESPPEEVFSEEVPETDRSLEERRDLVLRYARESPERGHLLQEDREYFDLSEGFLSYRVALWTPVVLGDPVSEPEDLEALLRAFLLRFPKAIFFNLSCPVATALFELDDRFRFCSLNSSDSSSKEVPFPNDEKMLRRLQLLRGIQADQLLGIWDQAGLEDSLLRYWAIPPRASVSRSLFRILQVTERDS